LIKDQFLRPSIKSLFDHPWILQQPDLISKINPFVQLKIQNNLIQYNTCSEFQKIVLSLISGLNIDQTELRNLKKEFMRLDKDKNGTLTKDELIEMTNNKLIESHEKIYAKIDWDDIIVECDKNSDGVIDFEEFIQACIDRKVLES